MAENLAPLTYAVRIKVVAKYLGQLMIMLSLLTLAPLAVSLAYGEYGPALRLVAVIAVLLAAGVPAACLPAPKQIQTNEALVVVAATFLVSAMLLAFPLAGNGLGFTDALFEAVSAVTTTGLSTLPTLVDRPHTFLFARAWMQWFGGLGIVVLSVALIMDHHIASRRLTEPVSGENLVTTARMYARRIVSVYFILTAAGVLLLWPFTRDTLTDVNFMLSAVSTGGFSPVDNSLAALGHWEARFIIMAFAFMGAVPLILYHHLYERKWHKVLADLELRGLAASTLATTVLLLLFSHWPQSVSWPETAAHMIITGISAQTTSGFSSVPIAGLTTADKWVLIVSMAVGGGVGSTAGGFKILRLLILLRLLQLLFRRSATASHAVSTPRLGGKALDEGDMIRTLLLIMLFIAVVAVSWLMFLAYGYDPLNALFEVVSATDTVGLSTGITRPTLEPFLKVVLCADMLLGRLEVFALLVVLYPKTWLGNRKGPK